MDNLDFISPPRGARCSGGLRFTSESKMVTGTLTATLSDGSVVPATLVLNDTNDSGPTLAVYTIDYKTASDNVRLSTGSLPTAAWLLSPAVTFIELTPPDVPLV